MLFRSLRENEFIGIRPSDLFRLNFSQWKNYSHKLVALTPVTFRNKMDFNAHRLLRAIDKNTLLSKLERVEEAQQDEIMFSEIELKNIYKDFPQLIYNTQKLLEQCEIDFEFGKNKNRKFFTATAKQDYHHLMSLCYDGLKYRYPNTDDKIIRRFEKEIHTITELGYSSYFLINYDIVRYAQSKNYDVQIVAVNTLKSLAKEYNNLDALLALQTLNDSELGDIIEINATNSDIDEQVFYVTYVDQESMRLFNITTRQVVSIQIASDGKLSDESIHRISLLSRSEEKGFARQNNLLPKIGRAHV